MVFSSCIVDDESSFIKDTFDPRVPQYSQEGANTAGAYINNQPWVARKRIVSSIFSPSPYTLGTMTFYHSKDTTGTFIAFEGGDQLIDQSNISCSIGFFLSEFNLTEPDDLQVLENKRIELDGIVNYGQMTFRNDFSAIVQDNPGIGTLHIRRVAKIRDSEWEISGTFGFSINSEGQEATVFSGRFDYEIFPEQFGEF
jgi:hypothetical protein